VIQAFSAARSEFASVRIEQEVLVSRVEHRAHLSNLDDRICDLVLRLPATDQSSVAKVSSVYTEATQ
jgi:hypothetical protein